MHRLRKKHTYPETICAIVPVPIHLVILSKLGCATEMSREREYCLPVGTESRLNFLVYFNGLTWSNSSLFTKQCNPTTFTL